MDCEVFFFISPPQKNPQTKSRPHSFPRPLSAGGKFSLGFAKSKSPENSFGKTESALKPHHLPDSLRAGSRKKCSHPFRKNCSRANQKSGEPFLRDMRAERAVVGLIQPLAILKIGASLVQ